MTSTPPPTAPGLFNLDLTVKDEHKLSNIKVRADSQLTHLENNYVSLSLAARNLLAVLRYYGDEEVEAEREFKVTLEQDPDNLNAIHSLVQLYRKSSRAELAEDMEHRLVAVQQHPLSLAHAQCLAEQAYAISFECIGQDILSACHDSNSWLERAMTMTTDLMSQVPQQQSPGEERDAILQKVSSSIFEWRLCMVWNLKKVLNRTKEEKEKKTLLLKALTTVAELLQLYANPNVSLAYCYLGYFLWKCTDPRDGHTDRQDVVALVKKHEWEAFLRDPALCFEQALASNTLTNAARNEAKRLFADYLSAARQDESTVRRLSAWLEESTRDQCSLTRSHLLQSKAWIRTGMVRADWNSMRHQLKLHLLQESVEELKEALRLRPGHPISSSTLAGAYNSIAFIHRITRNSAQEQHYGQEAITILEEQLRNPDRRNHAFLYRELHKAFTHAGVTSREVTQVQRRLLECEDPWRTDWALKNLLTQLSREDQTEDGRVAAATSAAFWIDFTCSRSSDVDGGKLVKVLQEMAHTQSRFARKVCACAEDMRNKGELAIRDRAWLENLRGMAGLQSGHVDNKLQQALASDRSEFSLADDITPRNWKGVAYDVGVVCAPDDVIWFHEGAWRHLVRELGMKVKLLPAEGDTTSLSRDCYKVLVVLSASFWRWAESAGHVAWLRERRWREGVGLERADAPCPPPPHLSDLAVLRQRVRLGQWADLLRTLL